MGGREGEKGEKEEKTHWLAISRPHPLTSFSLAGRWMRMGKDILGKWRYAKKKWREGRMAVWPHDSSLYLTTLPPPFLPFISIPHHLQLPWSWDGGGGWPSNHLVSLVIWVLHSNSLSYLFPSRFHGENGKEKRNSFQQLQMNSSFFTSFQLLFPNLLPSYKFLLETREVKRREVNES